MRLQSETFVLKFLRHTQTRNFLKKKTKQNSGFASAFYISFLSCIKWFFVWGNGKRHVELLIITLRIECWPWRNELTKVKTDKRN